MRSGKADEHGFQMELMLWLRRSDGIDAVVAEYLANVLDWPSSSCSDSRGIAQAPITAVNHPCQPILHLVGPVPASPPTLISP
jgi:hypothetical protein